MIELTISHFLNRWVVSPKHQTANRMYTPVIDCETFDEAMEIHQQLNGKKLQEIEAFIKLRKKLDV